MSARTARSFVRIDSTLVKAIARAFRWQRMLETGRYATVREIARAERINPSYVSRVLRSTLLAPATVEAILQGRASAAPTLAAATGCFRWRGIAMGASSTATHSNLELHVYSSRA